MDHPRFHTRRKRILQGMAMGTGAPLGWLAICLATGWFPEMFNEAPWYHFWLFLYMLAGSMISFGAFAAVIGANEEKFETLSLVDVLTKLFNARHFQHVLETEFANAARYNTPLSLIILDLDHFKEVNDRWGHQSGDLVLARVAGIVAETVRQGDTVARVGGEEFAVILPSTTSAGGRELAERIRKAVKRDPIALPGGDSVRIRVSLGVAGTDVLTFRTPTQMFAAVDVALYTAKQEGRDRVAELDAKGRPVCGNGGEPVTRDG